MWFKLIVFPFLLSFEIAITSSRWPARRSYPYNKECDEYESKMPNFDTGRISERKCLEYQWEIKDRINEINHHKKCGKLFVGIINGTSSDINNYPHMGALGWESINNDDDEPWVFFCGGSLISDHFVLTAAHCTNVKPFKNKYHNPKIVRFGTTRIREFRKSKENPVDIEIKKIITHPNYASPVKYFDIALLQLQESVTFTMSVHPACLWSKPEIDVSKKYTVTGWGTTKAKKEQTPSDLQSVGIYIFDRRYCSSLLQTLKHRNWKEGLKDHQMCAGKIDGSADTCQGDSGGPLQYKIAEVNSEESVMHMIVAVTSFAKSCAKKDSPGIYTKVNNFIDWIEKNVWRESDQNSHEELENESESIKLENDNSVLSERVEINNKDDNIRELNDEIGPKFIWPGSDENSYENKVENYKKDIPKLNDEIGPKFIWPGSDENSYENKVQNVKKHIPKLNYQIGSKFIRPGSDENSYENKVQNDKKDISKLNYQIGSKFIWPGSDENSYENKVQNDKKDIPKLNYQIGSKFIWPETDGSAIHIKDGHFNQDLIVYPSDLRLTMFFYKSSFANLRANSKL